MRDGSKIDYAADYSGTYNDRTLVDKAFVESLIAAIIITVDAIPTNGSMNPVSSDGVFDAFAALGTMSAQNANAVAITGGTIDGVVINGGIF